MVSFPCPHCHAPLDRSDSEVGTITTCTCGGTVWVPNFHPPAPAEEDDEDDEPERVVLVNIGPGLSEGGCLLYLFGTFILLAFVLAVVTIAAKFRNG